MYQQLNLKNKIDEQSEQKQTHDREKILMTARWERLKRVG